MAESTMFLVVGLALKLEDIVGRVATMFSTPSIGVLLAWIALVMSCSVFYVTNLLYNFSDLSDNKLRS